MKKCNGIRKQKNQIRDENLVEQTSLFNLLQKLKLRQSDEILNGFKIDQKKQEEQHLKTKERCMILVNEINQQKKYVIILEIIKQENYMKFNKLFKEMLYFIIKIKGQLNQFYRTIELTIQNLIEKDSQQVQDFDRFENKFAHPIGYEISREVPLCPPCQDKDVIKLRKGLLFLKEEKVRAPDEAEYLDRRQNYQFNVQWHIKIRMNLILIINSKQDYEVFQ
ncbi:unnamed protein product [Paramecium primaurelia]|nr:unnamed protein product [Paramecium primaurelia]CAD8118421.1 unnamed protein product [Paramecium primaurelia]